MIIIIINIMIITIIAIILIIIINVVIITTTNTAINKFLLILNVDVQSIRSGSFIRLYDIPIFDKKYTHRFRYYGRV